MITRTELQMEQVPIESLHPDPANPRRISDVELEALTKSIHEFGLIDPVIARREDSTVIGGHQRLLAARRLGLKEVPVIFLDVGAEQAHLLNLALNKISGSFDDELLARLLADLAQTPDLDLSLSGFESDEISKLLKTLESREKRDRVETFDLEAALEAAHGDPIAKPGDLFVLGDHRLLCGDATKAEDVQRLLAGTRAQMCFTDPPYNVSLGDHGGQQQGQRRRRLANDSLPPEEWEAFCRGWTGNLLASVDGALYVCMSTKEWPLVSRVLEEAGGHWSRPALFLEFDGTEFHRTNDPPNNDFYTYGTRLLLLPNGDVLFCVENDSSFYAYHSDTAQPQDNWRPVIQDCPATFQPGTTIQVSGMQFNGLSQAVGYGDDSQAATNYPLVRIVNKQTGRVRYCRTFNHTTVDSNGNTIASMGVATGNAVITTNVEIPFDIDNGDSQLFVVANAIPSAPFDVAIWPILT